MSNAGFTYNLLFTSWISASTLPFIMRSTSIPEILVCNFLVAEIEAERFHWSDSSSVTVTPSAGLNVAWSTSNFSWYEIFFVTSSSLASVTTISVLPLTIFEETTLKAKPLG